MERECTEASAFIEKFNQYDGRGTVIAVLDTGIDPGAPGLQSTTTGEHKLIQLIDCSGAGDVDMTTLLEATTVKSDLGSESKTLKGLTGRTLTIPANWPVPKDGKYRVGWKAASGGIFPKGVLTESGKERKLEAEKANTILLVQAMTNLAAHEKEFPKLDDNSALDQINMRNDLKARVDVLKDFMKDYKDPGLVYDCVSFHDGEKWWVAVDVSMSGDLSKTTLLNPYEDGFQFASFGDEYKLNYSVNVYDDGEVISIVTTSGAHGTHVASIAAAYFPDGETGCDGVAPGAQLMSLTIGDSRFSSAETTQSLVRAANYLARLKPDVVNISYGEYAGTYDYGRFTELIKDHVINENGCMFVSSAGNAGPILSSLSHPGGGSGLITVGAYQNKHMQDEMYGMIGNVPESAHSFTSMGPTLDGAVGVDIYAPGAAITSVPQFTKNASQLMNGTSMACPNAAGCIALLVSGLKQAGIAYTPYRVGNALRTTSKQFGEEFGTGLIQVMKAWDELSKGPSLRECLDVFYEINVGGNNRGRGIYLRELSETTTKQQFAVNVKPLFAKQKQPSTSNDRLQFDAHVVLKPSAAWISAPQFVRLASGGRDFLVRVDPTVLEPGLNYGYVSGIVEGEGECFRIPVTVCKNETEGGKEGELALRTFTALTFDSGVVQRRYLNVPLGATFATIAIESKDRVGSAAFMVQFGQLQQQTPMDTFESRWRVNMSSTGTGMDGDDFKWSKTIRVVEGKTAELVLCQNWSTLDPTSISVKVEFHGLELTASSSPSASFGTRSGGDLLTLNSGNATFTRCDLFSRLRSESVGAVSVVFKSLQKSLRPTDAAITVLKSRDILPDGKQLYQLVVGYSFKVTDDVNVTPLYPQALECIYDSLFESLLFMVFDSQQVLQSMHHAKPNKSKLKEGTYTVKMQIVSSNIVLLEKLKTTPLIVIHELKKSITLSSFKTLAGATSGGSSFDKTVIPKGQSATFWLPAIDDLPKFAQPGDLLVGKFKVTDSNSDSSIEIHNAAYLVPNDSKSKDSKDSEPVTPVLKKPDAAATPEKKAEEDWEVKLKEEQRDLLISYLKKSDGEKRDALMAKLKEDWPTFVPFHVAKLEAFGADFEKIQKKDAAKAVASVELIGFLNQACDALLNSGGVIDMTELAVYMGLKVDIAAGGEEAKTKKKEMDAQKSAVVLALLWKARLAKNRILALTDSATADEKAAAAQEFDESLVQLAKWLSPSDMKYQTLWVWRLKNQGFLGSALKVVCKFLGDSKNNGDGDKAVVWKEMEEFKKQLVGELGWVFWQQFEATNSAMISSPCSSSTMF
ncbi:tripeptidyl-peptidase II Tpp2 [Podochytrium sp. JEL0797]|nr:tripeptidyl-peptidase II Tpp2 [Podochytrium sp. JEL0797]